MPTLPDNLRLGPVELTVRELDRAVDWYQRSLGLRVSIADNGRGIAGGRRASGFGLTSMQERADKIGASLTIVTAPRSGTEVVLAWEPASLPTQVHLAG